MASDGPIENSQQVLYGLPQRARTGQFAEGFAREADKRRLKSVTTALLHTNHPLLPSTTAKPGSNVKIGFPWNYRARGDEESLASGDAPGPPPRNWIPRASIPVSYYRRRHKESKQILILGVEPEKPVPAATTEDLRWIETPGHDSSRPHIDPFKRFVDTAMENCQLPAETKSAIQRGLLELETRLIQDAFPGKSLPAIVKSIDTDGVETPRFEKSVSCIFFCFPYLCLGVSGDFEPPNIPRHSIRALVQSLYRTESPSSRELQQAVRKLNGNGFRGMVHEPQFWGLIINNDYLATYSPSQLHLRTQSSITTLEVSKLPSSFRLRLPMGFTFCLYWDECPSWLDFLIRVHRIYSQVLRMHVDPEECSYRSINPEEIVDAVRWADVAAKRPVLFDIEVLLPTHRRSKRANRAPVLRFPRDIDPITWNVFSIHPPEDDEYYDSQYYTQGLIAQLLYHTRARRDLRRWQDRSAREQPIQPELRYRYRCSSPESDQYDRLHQDHSYHDDDASGDSSNSRIPGSIRTVVSSPIRDSRYRQRFSSLVSEVRNPVKCHWPGCFNESSKTRTFQYRRFWAPAVGRREPPRPSKTPEVDHGVTLADFDLMNVPYLQWRAYSSSATSTQHRDESEQFSDSDPEQEQATVDDVPSIPAHVARDTKPLMDSLHRKLGARNDGQLYSNQYRMIVNDVHRLNASFGQDTPPHLVQFARQATDLVRHFMPVARQSSEVEMKCWGAMYGVFKICRDCKLPEPQQKAVAWAAKKVQAMLLVSNSIRTGVRGGFERTFLLKSLVDAFLFLVRGFFHLHAYLKPHAMKVETEVGVEEVVSEPLISPAIASGASPSNANTPDAGRDGNAGPSLPRMVYIEEADDDDEDGLVAASRTSPDSPELSIAVRQASRPIVFERHNNHNPGLDSFEKAERSLSRAKIELVQFFSSKDWKELGDYATVGANSIAASALDFLAGGDTGTLSPEEIYKEYCSSLRLLVRDSPRRSLLDDLDRVEEEIDSILGTISSQKVVIKELTYHPFRRWPTITSWATSLTRTLERLDEKAAIFRDLKGRVNSMRKQVVRQIELKQDNNSKAILVFTLVTVVFLPLSFVTSFFGMNTADIRDMDSGQQIFWAVSVPITLMIVGFAMTVAYQGDRFRAFLVRT